jgi:hypothetical protein
MDLEVTVSGPGFCLPEPVPCVNELPVTPELDIDQPHPAPIANTPDRSPAELEDRRTPQQEWGNGIAPLDFDRGPSDVVSRADPTSTGSGTSPAVDTAAVSYSATRAPGTTPYHIELELLCITAMTDRQCPSRVIRYRCAWCPAWHDVRSTPKADMRPAQYLTRCASKRRSRIGRARPFSLPS